MPPQFQAGRSVPLPPPRSLRERFGALSNRPPILKIVWQTSPTIASGTLVLRVWRAAAPVVTLYITKLIIDDVSALASAPDAPATLSGWMETGLLDRLAWLLGAELALAVMSHVLGRVDALLYSLLSAQFSNISRVR